MLLNCHVASLGSTCSLPRRNELLHLQQKLEDKNFAYDNWSQSFIKLDDETNWSTQDRMIPDINTRSWGSVGWPFWHVSGWVVYAGNRMNHAALCDSTWWKSIVCCLNLPFAIDQGLSYAMVPGDGCFLKDFTLPWWEHHSISELKVHNANSQRTTNWAWDRHVTSLMWG